MNRRSAFVLTCLVGCLVTRAAAQQPFLRIPDIAGDKVVFTCEDDLWLGDLTTSKAVRLTRDEGTEAGAQFSPDGSQIAFTGGYSGRSEVYVLPAGGGTPRRLTFGGSPAVMRGWTPDGRNVVYGSSQPPTGNTMYLMPLAGGFPTRLPLECASHLSYSPDGREFAFTRFSRAGSPWFRYEGGQKNDIWVGNPAQNSFRRIYESKGTNEYPVWVGDRIAFVHDGGDGRFSVMTVQPDGKGAKVVAGPYDVELRSMQTDGKRLIYERGLGLELCDLTTGQVRPVTFELSSDLMHTMPYVVTAGSNLRSYSFGPSGKRTLVETRGQVISVPSKEGDVRLVLAKDGVRYSLPTYAPDAAHIAYVSDETHEQQVYLSDPDGANAKPLTHDGGRQIKGLLWSDDSHWLALVDSQTRLRLIEVATGKEAEVSHGSWWSGPAFAFSPDSKWLACTVHDPISKLRSLMLYELATGHKVSLGDGLADDSAPAFSRDGKWLAFVSPRRLVPRGDPVMNQIGFESNADRVYLLALQKDTRSPFLSDDDEETPAEKPAEKVAEKTADKPADKPAAKPGDKPADKPAEKPAAETPKPSAPQIDIEGLYDRRIELPVAAADYGQLAFVGSRLLLQNGGSLTFYDVKEKRAGRVADGVEDFEISRDGKKLMLWSGTGSRVVDAMAHDVGDDGRISFGDFPLHINPRAEWEQIYWEGWRLIRDYFYVANMHGNDWPAIGAKYAKLLPSVRSRGELNELLRWLLAELSVSHAGVGGGYARGSGSAFRAIACLGAELTPDPSGYPKITHIYRGDGFDEATRSPLAQVGVGVAEGEYLVEVAGISAKDTARFAQALEGRAGHVVAIRVNSKPSAEGARTVRVKAVASDWDMRYADWVRHCREYVAKASHDRVGYIHLWGMGTGDMATFAAQYFPQRSKEALLIDVRFNGGGYIADHVLRVLEQKPLAFFNQRTAGESWTRQSDYFGGPMACLTNEYSSSDAEELPFYFRAAGLGPLVGRRTWGGEVGSSPGWPLVDGGVINVPNYGAFQPGKGWVIEATGVQPDFDVESDPNAFARGRDPQLDKAVELMLAALAQRPALRPVPPPDPVRVKPAL